jgi:hypothetical protein
MAIPLREIAEDAGAYLTAGPGDVRVILDDAVLSNRPASKTFEWTHASRLRLPPDPDVRIGEVRAWFTSQGCRRWMWMLGPSTTPSDLATRLCVGHDVQPMAEDGHRALLLDVAPQAGPEDVEIREVRTFEAFCELDDVQSLGFGESGAARAKMIASRRERWDDLRASANVGFVGYLEGEPVAGASMAPLRDGVWFLLGGATVPAARGRGLYRSLVHARWRAAMERGGKALATHAGSMSAPILTGLGFADAGRIDLLLERADADRDD